MHSSSEALVLANLRHHLADRVQAMNAPTAQMVAVRSGLPEAEVEEIFADLDRAGCIHGSGELDHIVGPVFAMRVTCRH